MNRNDTKGARPNRLLSEMKTDVAGTQVVATLAWADAVERLDILIMEIRHIQSNIAQLLRKPRLMNLLRYEEIFIWGTVGEADDKARAQKGQALLDWVDLFGELDHARTRLAELSSFFVLPIDSRSRRTEATGFDDVPMLERYQARRRRLIDDVSKDVAKSLYSSGDRKRRHRAQWGQDHRRNYHLFRALQRMKRNLVLAKLQLCWWGAWAYRLIGRNDSAPAIETRRLSHFIAVRAAVMVKLGDAVARLGDLQSQFERALDLGPQEIARPLGGRRRHGALTAAFLHNRSHELWTAMQELITELGIENPSSETLEPITTHRWNHDAQWSSHVIFDETTERRNVDENATPAIDFLVSSYWAPDRPDLQVMLAHDAAAAALRSRLPLADRMQLAGSAGPLADLLKMLNHTIDHYQPGPRSMLRRALATAGQTRASDLTNDDRSDRRATERSAADMSIDRAMAFDLGASFSRAKRDLLPLLAADLLAASVYGGAYLFALYQDLLGRGLEQLFRTPGGQIDLGIAKEALDLGHLDEEIPFYWYLRIEVVCAWLKVITFEGERSALGETMVGGIERLSTDLLEHTRDLYRGEARQWPMLWKELTGRLCLVVSSSLAADQVSTWRAERLRPYQDLPEGEAEPIRRNRRASRPMPPDIARFLKSALIRQKRGKPGRGLNRETDRRKADATDLEEAARSFEDLYLRHGETVATPADTLERQLDSLRFFRTLHDIPWEAAIMRGTDFLDDLHHRGPLRHSRWRGFGPISAMSLDFQPGRETFQVALDFQLFLSKRRADRLVNCLTLVNGILAMFEKPFENESLKTWFHAPPEESGDSGQMWSGQSPKSRLEHWIDPHANSAADNTNVSVAEIDKLSRQHGGGIVDDGAVRHDCEQLAARTAVENLLQLSAAVQVSADDDDVKQRVDPAAEYILDRIQHAKLEQLARAINRKLILAADIKPRQGGENPEILPVNQETPDWKAISSLIALHIYLEVNSTAGPEEDDDGKGLFKEKRRRTRDMILDALSGEPGSTKNGAQSIQVKEIGYLSISDAMDHPERPESEDGFARQGSERPEGETAEHHRRFRQLYDPPLAEIHAFARRPQLVDDGPDWPTATYAACLGRFDRILLSDSSPLLTHRLPRFSRTDDAPSAASGGRQTPTLPYHWDVPALPTNAPKDMTDVEEFSTFVQRREVALRLSLKTSETPADGLVPLALVSIGLTQRYSRLDFIARLLRAIRTKPMIGAYALEGAYHLIEPGDEAYLTDGAYDLTMVLMGPGKDRDQKIDYERRFARLLDVMRLSITLHGDFMVDRTETHLLAPMIDCVLAEKSHLLSIFQEVRLKESSTQQYAYRFLHEQFVKIVDGANEEIRSGKPPKNLPKGVVPEDFDHPEALQPRMHIIPGRADVAIAYESEWLKLHWAKLNADQNVEPSRQRTTMAGMLDQLMSIVLKDWYVDRIATTIGVQPEVLLAWKSSDPNGDPAPTEDKGEADGGGAEA